MIELKTSRRAPDGERIAHFFTSDFTFGDEFRGVLLGVFFSSSLSRPLVEERRGETDKWEPSSCVTSISAAGLQ